MGSCEILDLSDAQKWNDYIKQLPLDQQDIYYTPEYYQLYEELGDGKAKCFIYENDGELALYPFLINSINDLGYGLDKSYYDIHGSYGYNGVISSSLEKSFIDGFYNEFYSFCQSKNVIAEFTRFHPLIKNEVFSENELAVLFDRETVCIDLKTSFEEIFSHFQTTTRKQLRRAQNRYRISVKYYKKDIKILDTFYDIYYETMKRTNAIPYLFFNRQYFKSLLENTYNCCFVASYEDIAIAAIIIFYNKYYINGHLGGALTNYLYMAPFSLLYQEIIKFGQSLGCKYFHIGGGSDNSPDNSLLKFKSNFSKDRNKFYIGKKIHNQKIYNEVIRQWETKNPRYKEQSKNILLRYRTC